MTAHALQDVANLSVDIATGLGDTVIVFGVSLGGNVAAWTAQFRPVYRVVIAAPALGLSHLSTSLQSPTMELLLLAPAYSQGQSADTLRPDRTLGWSTRGVGEMLKLGHTVRRAADERRPLARDIRVIANLADRTVNRSAIDELVEHWEARGAPVSYYELSDTLNLPHDVVDPDEKGARTDVTNPLFLALLRGQTPTRGAGARIVSESHHDLHR
jgi:esterase/lipase